jgi:hypothetical protein
MLVPAIVYSIATFRHSDGTEKTRADRKPSAAALCQGGQRRRQTHQTKDFRNEREQFVASARTCGWDVLQPVYRKL